MSRVHRSALFLLLVTLSACTSQKARVPDPALPESEYQPAIIGQQEPHPVPTQLAGKAGVIRLRITDRGFSPPALFAHQGEQVAIHLVNGAGSPHNLVIPRFGIVTQPVPPGGQNYIEFTAAARGTWPFFSDTADKPGFPEPGFSGSLQVE